MPIATGVRVQQEEMIDVLKWDAPALVCFNVKQPSHCT